MKRAFIFALLAALPAGVVLAQAGPPMGGVPGGGQQAAAPQAALAGNPGQAPAAGGLFGQAPGGNIGGGAAIGGAGAGLAAGAPAGGAEVATQTTVGTSTQATVVSGQALTAIQHPWMINRVIHHVVSKDFEQQFGGNQLFAPMVGFNPVAPFPVPAFGDLELIGVGMVADMHGDQGPLYRVTIKNSSHLPVMGVRVSLIAVLGALDRSSPVITTEVKEIAAGGIATLDVQMPVAVMQLGPATAQVPFETLIASIDSFNELPETSEFNNVITVTRSNIAVIETAQSTTTTTTVAAAAGPGPGVAAAPAVVGGNPAGPAPGAPAGEPAPGGAAPAVAAPMGGEAAPMGAAVNPQDSALQNLNLENVENASAPE